LCERDKSNKGNTIVSTDERPYAKVGKLTKKEMGNSIHNCNPKSLKTVKVQ
jgi:hypothetical protein